MEKFCVLIVIETVQEAIKKKPVLMKLLDIGMIINTAARSLVPEER